MRSTLFIVRFHYRRFHSNSFLYLSPIDVIVFALILTTIVMEMIHMMNEDESDDNKRQEQ